MNIRKLTILLLFTTFTYCAKAQFLGGTSGTGTNIKLILTAYTCPLTYDSSLLLYRGGNYGSYSTSNLSSMTCTFNIDSTLVIFKGGFYGGYSTEKINAITCAVSLDSTQSVYKGGYYGNYSTAIISNSTCVYALDSSVLIYKGGYYSSYSTAYISSTTCPYPDPLNIWMGGNSSNNAPGILNNNLSNNVAGPFISTISDTSILNGNCVTLNTTGVGATSYSWSPTSGLSNAFISNPVANPTTTTIYTVTATGSTAGCKNVSTVVVNVIDNNGATSISYPSQINSGITTLQNVTLTGITNGVFSASSANLKINTANGAITPNTSTIGTYVVTYTYGSCNSTVTANITITSDAANHGEVVYPNFFLGATSGSATPKQLLTQASCIVPIDYTLLLYVGGTSGSTTPKTILSQAACTALIDYTQSLYVGGTSGNNTPKTFLTQGACTPFINPSNTIYMGGTSGANTPKVLLTQLTCSVPVGNNFYLGGSGNGYGNGNLMPTTSSIAGTSVATIKDTTICPGTPIILTTTGATNYTWTPATGLDNTLNGSPTATPQSTTTYTVVGSGSGVGCINTAIVRVTVLRDSITSVSYGAFNFDEADFTTKKVKFIYGPLTGTFSAFPSGLNINATTGSFVPGLSTSGGYRIDYAYTKGSCNYIYSANVNLTTLPPDISYVTPTILYLNYANNAAISPTNLGGAAELYELIDSLPTGLSLNTVTGIISGTPSQLVDTVSVRIRAANHNKLNQLNYSTNTTLVISVKKPFLSKTVNSIASLNTTYGNPSPTSNFQVTGSYIIDNIVLDAPVGFELSRSANAGFSSRITIPKSSVGVTFTSTIYVRLSNVASVGNAIGTIVISSNKADGIQLPIAESYVAPAPLTITAKYFQKFYGSRIILGVGSPYFAAQGLVNDETIGSVTITPSGGTEINDAVGFYDITPTAAIDGSFNSANYNITYTPAQFQVLYSLYNFNLTGNNSNWVKGKVPSPIFSNITVNNITNISAIYSVKIPSSFVNISQRGVCWSTVINPTTIDSKIINGTTATGALTANITALESNTLYFVRSYVVVGGQTYYSSNYKFTTN